MTVRDDRRRAELLADIAASAIPHSGPLRDVSEFREIAALCRPSILRRAAADLAAEVPREAVRLVAAGWQAVVLATALSLHTGLPLCVATGPDAATTHDDAGLSPGRPVALVVVSAADDAEVTAWVAGLEAQGTTVTAVLSLMTRAARSDARVPRTVLLTEEELAVSIAGGRP